MQRQAENIKTNVFCFELYIVKTGLPIVRFFKFSFGITNLNVSKVAIIK